MFLYVFCCKIGMKNFFKVDPLNIQKLTPYVSSLET